MAVSWPCPIGVAAYAAGRSGVVVPRAACPACGRPMAFDGSYARRVRQEGVVHRIVVQRARCSDCGASHALLPDFVLHRRRDSADAIGAGVVGHGAGVHLYEGVPARTVRSWRHRFAERAELLVAGLMAVATTWAGEPRSWPYPRRRPRWPQPPSGRRGGRPVGEGHSGSPAPGAWPA